MDTVNVTINGKHLQVPAGITILEAARRADIYIPSLCYHPDLPPAGGTQAVRMIFQGDRKIKNAMPGESGKGCGVCVVQVDGRV